jgi:hypothetical protein
MQNTTTGLFNLIKIFIFGVACLISPKAIANPTPSSFLPSDPIVAGNSQPAPVESSSFNAQISRSARDLLPDEVKASGFMSAQTDSLSPEDSTAPDPSNLDEPTEPADETPKEDSAAAAWVIKLAKKAQNPIANLISLPFQNNTNFGVGSLVRTQNILNIQPVIPVSLSKDLLLITRTSYLSSTNRNRPKGEEEPLA